MSSGALLFKTVGNTHEMPYNTTWVLWQQVVILVLLYLAPGSLFDSVPIFIAQGYLLVVSLLYRDDKSKSSMVKSAALLLLLTAGAGLITAIAALQSMTTVYDRGIGTIHLAFISAAAVVIATSSAHIINHASKSG